MPSLGSVTAFSCNQDAPPHALRVLVLFSRFQGGFPLYSEVLNDGMDVSQPEECYRGFWNFPSTLLDHSLVNKTNLASCS